MCITNQSYTFSGLCKTWSSELGLTIVSDSEELTGYRLYVVEDWLLDSSEDILRSCVVEATGDPNDKVRHTKKQYTHSKRESERERERAD